MAACFFQGNEGVYYAAAFFVKTLQGMDTMSIQEQKEETVQDASSVASEGDVVEQEQETEQPSADQVVTMESLQEALDEAVQQASENWEKFMRSQAELDNVMKRSKRDLENAHKFALEKFVNELIPVRDSLEMGLDHAEGEAVEPEKLREGSEMTLRMLSQVMERFNVQQLVPQGEVFDPKLHEAMTIVPTDEVEPDCIVKVIQKGYTLSGRLVRPARVIVAKAPG